jgi:hypothetical protein
MDINEFVQVHNQVHDTPFRIDNTDRSNESHLGEIISKNIEDAYKDYHTKDNDLVLVTESNVSKQIIPAYLKVKTLYKEDILR